MPGEEVMDSDARPRVGQVWTVVRDGHIEPKLAGFDKLDESPLRFVELQVGYFTQGYTDAEREAGTCSTGGAGENGGWTGGLLRRRRRYC